MAKTGAEGVALCRTLLSTSGSDEGRWSDDELYALMTDAQNEIAGIMPPRLLGTNLVTSSGATSVSGNANNPYFTRPAAVLRTTDLLVQRTSGAIMKPVTQLESMTALARQRAKQNYSTATEQSDFYVEQGDKLYLHPTYTTTVYYHLFYVKVPTVLTSTEEFDVPDHLYEWVCYRAVVSALVKGGEYEKAAKFNEILTSKVQSFREIWKTEPPVPFVSVPKQG